MTTPPANDASKSDQPGENAPTFRVRTLGLRNADTDEQTVHDAIAARFKVSAGRARAIVKGRVVATDLKPGKARALKAELLKLGVVAKVENAQTVAEPLAKGATADLTGFLDGLSSRYSGHVQRDTKYKFMSAAMFAAAMLLPLTYLLVIVGLVIGTGAYAMAVPVKVSVGGVLLWITPIVVSLALLVFLARPLFMRVSRPTRVAIDPQIAPQLYKLVAKVTAATGVPMPEKIFVDNNANAYVSSNGLLGLVGKRLELTVGLPLVYGFNTLHFTSVLAHEFGHFSQSFDMFNSALVNRVNSWLGRCGWYKDPLEKKLEDLAEHSAVQWVQLPIVAALWAMRGVSWCFRKLYVINLRITHSLSRQMEYNADDHAVQIAGSEAFVATSHRFRELIAGEQTAWDANLGAYNENRLFLNLSAAVVEVADGLDDAAKSAIRAAMAEETTEYWSTHPADKDRNERAQACHVADMAGGQASAMCLFKEVDSLAAQVTLQVYQRDRGMADAQRCVVDNREIFELQRKQGDNAAALEAFLGNAYDGRLMRWQASSSLNTAQDGVESPANDTLPVEASAQATLEDFYATRGAADDLFLSMVMARCGIVMEPGAWGIEDHRLTALEQQTQSSDARMTEAHGRVRELDALIYRQFELAMPKVPPRHEERAGQLFEWLGQAEGLCEHIEQLRVNERALTALLHVLEDNADSDLHASLDDFTHATIELLNELIILGAKLANPLVRVTQALPSKMDSVATFLATWQVRAIDRNCTAADVQAMAANALNATHFLYARALGELADYALQAQTNPAAKVAPAQVA